MSSVCDFDIFVCFVVFYDCVILSNFDECSFLSVSVCVVVWVLWVFFVFCDCDWHVFCEAVFV